MCMEIVFFNFYTTHKPLDTQVKNKFFSFRKDNLININAQIVNVCNVQIQCFYFENVFYSTDYTFKNV